MKLSRNTLYLTLSGACIAGYGWLFYQREITREGKQFGVCMIKHVTTVPCPSCGSTRAVMALMDGDVMGSLMMNPFGMIIALIMLISPVWVLIDLIRSQDTLFRSFKSTESFLRTRWVAVTLIMLVAANWIWNIYKEV